MTMQADEILRRRLERSLEALEPPAGRVDQAILRGRRRRVRARVTGIGVAVLAALAVAAPLALLSPLLDHSEETDTGTEHGRAVIGARIRLDPGITDVASSAGSVWVVDGTGVTRLDAETDRIAARIDVPGTGDHGSIALGEGSVWVTAPERRGDGTSGNLVRIDPATNQVTATVRVGGPISGVGIGGGWVWVTRPETGPGSLIRVDPGTGRVVDERPVGTSPGPPVYAEGYVWVASTDEGVSKVDPVSGRVIDVLRIPPVETAADGSLWAVGDDSVVRLDPESGAALATIAVERAVHVATAGTTLWVLSMARSSDPTLFEPIAGTAAVTRIDTSSNRIVGDPIRLVDLQPLALVARGRSAWVGDYDGGTVTRIAVVPDP
jgi:hypothetical protein